MYHVDNALHSIGYTVDVDVVVSHYRRLKPVFLLQGEHFVERLAGKRKLEDLSAVGSNAITAVHRNVSVDLDIAHHLGMTQQTARGYEYLYAAIAQTFYGAARRLGHRMRSEADQCAVDIEKYGFYLIVHKYRIYLKVCDAPRGIIILGGSRFARPPQPPRIKT